MLMKPTVAGYEPLVDVDETYCCWNDKLGTVASFCVIFSKL